MTNYTLFTLDGFHNRMLDDWREVRHRWSHAGRVVPAHYEGNRWVKEYYAAPFDVVECWPWRTTARKHAREHGAAGVWHADDSFTLFYRDGDKVRTKRFAHAKPVENAA